MADRQAQVECGVIGVTDAFDVGLKLARGSAERAHLARARRDLAMLKAGAGSVRVGMASVISGLGRPGGGVVAQGSGRPQMMSGAADGRPGASGASASPRTFAEVAKRSEFGHLFVSSPGNSVASTRRDLSSDRPMQKTVAIKPTALPLAFHASALRNHRAAHGTPKAAAKAGRGALPNDAAQAISPPLKPVTGNQHTAHSSLAPQVYDSAVAPIVSDARATAARVKWERPASGGSVNAGVTGIGTVGTPPTRSIISAAAALLARGAPDRGTNFGDAARPRSSRHTDAVPGTAPMVAGHEPRAGGRRRAAAQPFAPPAATFQTAASKAPAGANDSSGDSTAALPYAAAITGSESSAVGGLPNARFEQNGAGQIQGDVYLDGTLLGRWMSRALSREAGRPPTGGAWFDPRRSPLPPGRMIGG